MKAYVKPELYFESFELATHIASCSGHKIPTGDWPNNCLPDTDNPLAVGDGFASITGEVSDPQHNEDYCYTAGPLGNPLS